jgi:hypothetical protein
MFEKALQVLEGFQRLDQFLEVLEPPRRLRRLVVLPMRGVARLVEDHLGQFDMGKLIARAHVFYEIVRGRRHRARHHRAPARETFQERLQFLRPLAAQRAGLHGQPRALDKAHAIAARQPLDRGCALSPSPRLGVFTIRSKARSSSG